MTGKRNAFRNFSKMFSDMMEGSRQYSEMAIYFGRACNSLDAQLRVLLSKRTSSELIEVTNEDMEFMRQSLVTGTPIYISHYSDGVTKVYPLPEAEKS